MLAEAVTVITDLKTSWKGACQSPTNLKCYYKLNFSCLFSDLIYRLQINPTSDTHFHEVSFDRFSHGVDRSCLALGQFSSPLSSSFRWGAVISQLFTGLSNQSMEAVCQVWDRRPHRGRSHHHQNERGCV